MFSLLDLFTTAAVSSDMWQMLPILYETFTRDGFDYFTGRPSKLVVNGEVLISPKDKPGMSLAIEYMVGRPGMSLVIEYLVGRPGMSLAIEYLVGRPCMSLVIEYLVGRPGMSLVIE